LEKGVEAEIASFENELSVDIDWNSSEILNPSNYVEHWRLILWEKAFRVYFEDNADLTFSKGLDLFEFAEGPIAIKRVAYRYYFPCIFYTSFLLMRLGSTFRDVKDLCENDQILFP
jgi:hypothetical protein